MTSLSLPIPSPLHPRAPYPPTLLHLNEWHTLPSSFICEGSSVGSPLSTNKALRDLSSVISSNLLVARFPHISVISAVLALIPLHHPTTATIIFTSTIRSCFFLCQLFPLPLLQPSVTLAVSPMFYSCRCIGILFILLHQRQCHAMGLLCHPTTWLVGKGREGRREERRRWKAILERAGPVHVETKELQV